MFAHLHAFLTGRPPPEVERHAFVEEVRVRYDERRNPKVERMILFCWVLITIKHVLIIWACTQYKVPFHQLWINFPTWLLGAIATSAYFWHARPRRAPVRPTAS